MKYLLVTIITVVCVLNYSMVSGCGRSRRGRRSPPRDRTKPTIKCPPDIETIADPFQINTKVWWDEKTITANDDRDGPITPVRSGKAPGKLFSGTSKITYSAKDKGGNYASCSFYIIVKILICPTWDEVQDGWKICHVGHQMRRGSICRFGCYAGHELVGQSRTTCLDSQKWDTATQPYCQKLQCDGLLPSVDQYGVVDISCTDSNYYRSKCSYNCKDGYSILPGHSKVRVCNEYGNWRGSMPICEDTSPPVFESCPYVKVGYAERSKTAGRVWWNDPYATDNSGSVNTIQISGPTSGSELEVGEYSVTYMASDAVNNTALCEFNVVVKQIKCHKIYPLPYTYVVCPEGRILGSSCEFTCDNGTALNGHAHAQCDKTGTTIPYGRWTFMNNQPYCENIDTCPALRPPDNGALACDTWLKGKFCQILCEDGYVVMNDPKTKRNEVDVQKNLLVCGDSGTWYISANIPNCQEVDNERLLTFVKLKFEYYYYEGPCNETREDIKAKFLVAFTKGIGTVCEPPKCTVGKVLIFCGSRSGDSSRKRKSDDPAITFSMTVELPNEITSTDKTVTRNSITNSVSKASVNGDLNFEIDGFSAKSPSTSVSHIEGECSEGNAYDRKTMQCVKCNVGYFHDTNTDTCSACARGFYQDQPKQSTCKQCPTGKTTRTTGAFSAAQCEGACQPGFYSSTGTPPCSACDLGFYNENYGSVECTVCKGSQITLKSGSTSGSQCKEFDVTYNRLNESDELAAASLETQADSLSQFTLTLFVKCSHCDSLMTLVGTDNTDLSITHSDNILIGYNGQQYTTGESIVDTMMWTQITIKNFGTELIIFLDSKEVLREKLSSRRRRSTETPVNMTVTIGGEGFIGSISQLNMWSDVTTFTPVVTDTCFSTGQGDLVNWRQFSDTDGSFVLTKSKCDVDNNCDSTSCYNGGSCTDSIGSFSCACSRGFTGSFCEINIDDCLHNACDNNATCVDGHDEYSCVCPAGFKGDLCETRFVDGGWTEYEVSGECSVTCGAGTQQMSRVCENPIPINGGKQCEGDNTKTVPCETNVVCINECGKDPTTLNNGNMNCIYENDKERVCRPTCNDGYEFDSDLYINSSGIVCGPETGYVWNINNEDNPESQIPSCQPKHLAPKLTVNQTGVYNTLSTETSDVEDSIKSTVGNKLKTVGCVSNGTCELKDVHISSSTDQSGERKRRETSSSSTDQSGERKRRETSYVSFTVELTCGNNIGKDRCYDLLAEIVTVFNTLVQNLAFTIQYDGVDYDVGVNSTYLDGMAECEAGYASVWQYCVSCGKGTYATNDYCEICPRGYYQDEEAQTSCKKCPDGWTTAGLMSRDSIYCSIEKPTDVTEINWRLYCIIAGSVTIVIIMITVAAVLWCNKSDNAVHAEYNAPYNIANENSNQKFQMTAFNKESSASVENYQNEDYHGACHNPTYTDARDYPRFTDASGALFLETNLSKPPLTPPPVYKTNALE